MAVATVTFALYSPSSEQETTWDHQALQSKGHTGTMHCLEPYRRRTMEIHAGRLPTVNSKIRMIQRVEPRHLQFPAWRTWELGTPFPDLAEGISASLCEVPDLLFPMCYFTFGTDNIAKPRWTINK